MIKLIASDMDGTLLNDRKELPPDFYDILNRLDEKGIHFVAASGRSFSTLKILFEQCGDKMDYICDNGAYVVVGGKLVSVNLLDKGFLAQLVDVCLSIEGVIPVLCGVNGIYFEKGMGGFQNEVSKYYMKYTCVDDIRSVNDDIIKVAVFDALDSENNSYPILNKRFKDVFNVSVTGKHWIDVMNAGVNKGAALEKIRAELGYTREETMAFGDYFNDAELISAAGYGFVMENAHKDMFRYGKYRAKSNNECGVTEAIKKYALEEIELFR